MADGIFFDEKQMLSLGWPLSVVQAIKRVFEADAVNLQIEIDGNTTSILINTANIATNTGNISTNATNIATNSSDITSLSLVVANKVDKVSGAVLDNVATLLANGNIQDSGKKLSDYVIIIGTGAPEGVVTANQSKLYIDDAVPTQYFNPVPGNNTGWVAL